MTGVEGNMERKRDCYEEEGVGSNFKSPNQLPSKMTLTTQCYIEVFKELLRARFLENPYENRELTWKDDRLWKMVIENVKVQVPLSVEQLLEEVFEFGEKYELGDVRFIIFLTS
ncbi:hypothetical protein RND81_01G075700 [Saponaria officinalis]|uniref:Uncharacterized protein n=1 Tax=Saponaria officinalis TaxID=3572 RepID=A0AAW1N967_SAPOF